MPIALAALAGVGIAGGVAAASGAFGSKATAPQVATQPQATAAQTVGDKTANATANANNAGRAALISTSPSGVLGTDPTGRRKLLGND